MCGDDLSLRYNDSKVSESGYTDLSRECGLKHRFGNHQRVGRIAQGDSGRREES